MQQLLIKSWKNQRDPQRKSKIKTFMNKYNWNGIKYPSKIDDWKAFEKNIQQLLLIFYIINKKKYTLLIFQNITQPVKNKYFFYVSEWKKRKMALSCSKKIICIIT